MSREGYIYARRTILVHSYRSLYLGHQQNYIKTPREKIYPGTINTQDTDTMYMYTKFLPCTRYFHSDKAPANFSLAIDQRTETFFIADLCLTNKAASILLIRTGAFWI
jgi:hypothetical protein